MARPQSSAHSLGRGEIRSTDGLPVVNPHAAGADIGVQQIYVCIPGPDQTQIVRAFGSTGEAPLRPYRRPPRPRRLAP